MLKYFIAPLALVAATIASVQVASATPVRFSSAGSVSDGNYYELVQISGGTVDFNQARTAALNSTFHGMNGRLAGVYDQPLQTFLAGLITAASPAGNSQAYIGGQRDSTGTFKWVDHGESLSSVTYDNWLTGEPNNSGGVENVVSIFLTGANAGLWNDIGETTRLDYYFVEYSPIPVPVPASMPMMAAGLGALVFMARRKKKVKEAAAKLA